MKTVTGKLVSNKPISLSNAAKYFSRFASSDNGASPAMGVYLQRASDAFKGLVHLQKKLKGSQPHGIDGINAKVEFSVAAHESPQEEKKFELKNQTPLEVREREGWRNKRKDRKGQVFNAENVNVKSEVFEKKKKSAKEKRENEGIVPREVVDAVEKELKMDEGLELQGSSTKRDKKKKVKKGEGEEGKMVEDRKSDEFDQSKQERIEEGSMEMRDRKKKKRKRSEGEEVDRSLGGEEGKKRKIKEADAEETVDLNEQSGKKKKKKRRKIEANSEL